MRINAVELRRRIAVVATSGENTRKFDIVEIIIVKRDVSSAKNGSNKKTLFFAAHSVRLKNWKRKNNPGYLFFPYKKHTPHFYRISQTIEEQNRNGYVIFRRARGCFTPDKGSTIFFTLRPDVSVLHLSNRWPSTDNAWCYETSTRLSVLACDVCRRWGGRKRRKLERRSEARME